MIIVYYQQNLLAQDEKAQGHLYSVCSLAKQDQVMFMPNSHVAKVTNPNFLYLKVKMTLTKQGME